MQGHSCWPLGCSVPWERQVPAVQMQGSFHLHQSWPRSRLLPPQHCIGGSCIARDMPQTPHNSPACGCSDVPLSEKISAEPPGPSCLPWLASLRMLSRDAVYIPMPQAICNSSPDEITL